jgi:hypothetical protein
MKVQPSAGDRFLAVLDALAWHWNRRQDLRRFNITPDFRRGCGDSPVSIPASNSAIVMPKHRAINTMAWKERFFSPCSSAPAKVR